MIKNFIFCSVLFFLLACQTNPVRRDTSIPLRTVDYVDLSRYTGKWYNIANYPVRFQNGCSDTKAIYSLRDDNQIDVLNSCIKDGKYTEELGIASIADKATNAKLRVKFSLRIPDFLIPESNYWIILLDENYKWAVAATPDSKLLWILARSPNLDLEISDMILSKLFDMGYDIEALEITQHSGL